MRFKPGPPGKGIPGNLAFSKFPLEFPGILQIYKFLYFYAFLSRKPFKLSFSGAEIH